MFMDSEPLETIVVTGIRRQYECHSYSNLDERYSDLDERIVVLPFLHPNLTTNSTSHSQRRYDTVLPSLIRTP